MKINVLWAIPAFAALLRGWGRTWRHTHLGEDELRGDREVRDQGMVYCVWHRTIVGNSYLYRDLGACIGSSDHGDGEIGARMAVAMGFCSVRGSSSRGGSRLLRELLRFARDGSGDITLTADGPKGPARHAKPGLIYLASRLGWPLVPTALAASPCKVLNSWDRTIIPAPFARVVTAASLPMEIPRDFDRERVPELCAELDRRMAVLECRVEEYLRSRSAAREDNPAEPTPQGGG